MSIGSAIDALNRKYGRTLVRIGPWTPPPIPGTERLVPITSWPEMYIETEATKVEFDLFWYDCVLDGVAYFFRWLGEPRAASYCARARESTDRPFRLLVDDAVSWRSDHRLHI
jgi:hypothetical protein